MKLRTIIPWVCIFGGIALAVFLLRALDEGRKPVPQPTRTPVLGVQTQVFVDVNNARATQALPTFTPGLSNEQLAGTLVQATLVTYTPSPTNTLPPTRTPPPTNTPQPTYTRIPPNTAQPGQATVVWDLVQETRTADGLPTWTPGPSRDEVIATAVELAQTPSATPRHR